MTRDTSKRPVALAGTLALLLAAPLAAPAADLPQTVAEADAAFSLAIQWVNGEL
jgi:hypothetical protein